MTTGILDFLEAYLYTLRKLQSPRIFAKAAFSDGVTILIMFFGLLSLGRDGQLSVVEVNLNAFFRDTRELERRGDYILLVVFVEIHSISDNLLAFEPSLKFKDELPWLI